MPLSRSMLCLPNNCVSPPTLTSSNQSSSLRHWLSASATRRLAVETDPELGPRLNLGDGRSVYGSRVSSAERRLHLAGSPRTAQKGLRAGTPGCYDINARLKDQELDGIDAEVLYPSVLFNVYQIEDLEIVKATFAVLQRLDRRLLQGGAGPSLPARLPPALRPRRRHRRDGARQEAGPRRRLHPGHGAAGPPVLRPAGTTSSGPPRRR